MDRLLSKFPLRASRFPAICRDIVDKQLATGSWPLLLLLLACCCCCILVLVVRVLPAMGGQGSGVQMGTKRGPYKKTEAKRKAKAVRALQSAARTESAYEYQRKRQLAKNAIQFCGRKA